MNTKLFRRDSFIKAWDIAGDGEVEIVEDAGEFLASPRFAVACAADKQYK